MATVGFKGFRQQRPNKTMDRQLTIQQTNNTENTS